MSNARPVVQNSMELARRINDSTDIVTDLTDVVQNELPQKALQGDNPEATNSEILRAIDNIDIDTSELAKEETLVQGVSGIRSDIANIPAPDLSEVAKQGDNPNATNTVILEAFSHIDFSALATKADQEAAAELLILKQRIGESIDPDTAQTIFGKIAAVLTAVTNIDFSSIAKELTLLGVRDVASSTLQTVNAQSVSILNTVNSQTAAVLNNLQAQTNAILTNSNEHATVFAKQGDNEEATNTAILNAIEDTKNDVIFISDSVTQLALQPNKLYILHDRTQDMSFTLVSGDSDVMNEYHVIINFGNYNVFPTFTFPDSVEFLEPIEDPIVYKFDKLEFSILNDLCVWVAKDL